MSDTVFSSRLKGFYKQHPTQRWQRVTDQLKLSESDHSLLAEDGALSIERADGMIENVIGKFELPLGIATNFLINGQERLIPMVVEEPSVVAAASYMARIARDNGGFETSSTAAIMRAQVQLVGITDPQQARQRILAVSEAIIATANARDQTLLELGGGCQGIEVHVFESTPRGAMVVVHLLVDVRDAMGANAVNTMAEAVAPLLEQHSGGTARLRILSNYADLRLSRAKVVIAASSLATDQLSGDAVIEGILDACAFASVDPYRAATHNKGIMNGIDPIVIATGNDWRAVEAGAHAWATRDGHYGPLSNWEVDNNGCLVGTLEMPMSLGLVGGITKTHPLAQLSLRILGCTKVRQLAEICVAVGLAQNLAALRALVTEGIQRGHMGLHARNVALMAGATGDDIDVVASQLIATGDVRADRALEILSELKGGQ